MGTRAIDARIRRDSCYLGRHKNSSRESLYGLGNDAGELNGYASTHLTNKCYDRLVVAGVGKWVGLEVLKPPFGRKPNAPTSACGRIITSWVRCCGRISDGPI